MTHLSDRVVELEATCDGLRASLRRREADVQELAESARAFADALGAPCCPGPLEERLRAAIRASIDFRLAEKIARE